MTITPPAPDFGLNLDAVTATTARLGEVLEQLNRADKPDDAWDSALVSRTISRALEDFQAESSDQRGKIAQSVQALTDMLTALVQAVHEVDAALSGALPSIEEQADPRTAPEPGPAP